MLNLSVSSLRTDHLYVPHEIADIAQRSGLYRMKGLFAPDVYRHSSHAFGVRFSRIHQTPGGTLRFAHRGLISLQTSSPEGLRGH